MWMLVGVTGLQPSGHELPGPIALSYPTAHPLNLVYRYYSIAGCPHMRLIHEAYHCASAVIYFLFSSHM